MTVKEGLGLTALVLPALAAIAWLANLLSAPEKLERHIVAESTYHAMRDTVMKELDNHAEDMESLVESVVRGECIENPARDLARQGLLRKCEALGIRRTP